MGRLLGFVIGIGVTLGCIGAGYVLGWLAFVTYTALTP